MLICISSPYIISQSTCRVVLKYSVVGLPYMQREGLKICCILADCNDFLSRKWSKQFTL